RDAGAARRRLRRRGCRARSRRPALSRRVRPEGGMSAAITVDVDGLAGLECRPGGPWDGRLTARSEHEFVWRGLERVLEVLARFQARATFYVPGVTLEENPSALREVVAAGHDVEDRK